MKAPFPAPTNEWHNASYASINPSRPELSAKGKKIVVTGGGYGIGRETAKSFALAGAAGIAITGRKEAPLLETKKFIESEYKVPVSTHVADITDVAAMKKAASEIGEWDVLVMNAGYMSTPGTTLGSDVDEWWKAFEINIKGSFITVQTLLPTKGKAPIIVGTSTAAVVLPASMITDGSSYVASKLGLIKFLEILAAEYPDVHITTIHPGIVETDMLSKSGMVGVPIDSGMSLAVFTVWVASPEAAFLKGKFAYCNWDVDELKAKAQKIQETDVFTSGIMGNNPYSPDF